MRPCRLHMLAGSCTTASATTAPSSIPFPSETALPSVAYACGDPRAELRRVRRGHGRRLPGVRNSRTWSCRPTSPSCSSVTARPSGAARVDTRRTPTSRSRRTGASRRAPGHAAAGRRLLARAHAARGNARATTCAFAGLRAARRDHRRSRRVELRRLRRPHDEGDPRRGAGLDDLPRRRARRRDRRRRSRRVPIACSRARSTAGGVVALFSHGHFLRVLGARLDRPAGVGRRVARTRHRDAQLSRSRT